MFNLEQSISEWRKQLFAAGVRNPLPLEELESHLREDIAGLVASGKTEAAAFQIAIARVGNPGTVGAEYKKTNSPWSGPFAVASIIWTVLATAFLMFITRGWFGGKLNALLTAHIFSLTMGYVTAFLTGGLGMYGVYRQWRRMASADDRQRLNRAIQLFTLVSAVLVAGGFVLGMIWSSQNRGTIWANEAREIGPLCAVVWLLAVTSVQRFGQLSSRNVMRVSIVGNMVVSLAWFGAWGLTHGSSMGSYWPLEAFLGVHLLFLGLGARAVSKSVEA